MYRPENLFAKMLVLRRKNAQMHKMHNNSVVRGHVTMIENTFFNFFALFVALLKVIYYNVQYIF